MAKKNTKKRDAGKLEPLLMAILAELEELTRKQSKTARELCRLKKRLGDGEFCKRRRLKKKKKSKKSEVEETTTLRDSETQAFEASGDDGEAMPVGLLNIVSAPVGGVADDLKWIAGIGPRLEDTLNELGVFHYEQIANWDQSEVDWVDEYLQFSGRIERDNWIEQAKALAKGGRDEYVKVFGKEPR